MLIRFLSLFLLCSAALPLCGRVSPVEKLRSVSRFSVRYRYFEPVTLAVSDKNPDAVSYYKICYDHYFRIVGALQFDKGKLVRYWRYFYSKTGALRLCTQYRGSGLRYSWAFDRQGRVKRKMFHAGYTAPFKWIDYVYGRKGRLFMQRTLIKGKLLDYCYFEYHPDGYLFYKTSYTSGGNVSGRSFYKTEASGKIVEEHVYGWGRLMRVVRYYYNKVGFLISQKGRKPTKEDLLVDPYHKKAKLQKRTN